MITISTFNIQNDIKNYKKEKQDIIINYLKKNKIDILSLQEVYSKLDKDLTKTISTINYSIKGDYRFFLKRILNRINEKTPIITNKKILSSKTYHLPYLPSLLKRVITKIEIEDNNKIISIYNTHLDYKYDVAKKRQLKRILKIISKDKNLIILTGDFNLKNNNPIFIDFVKELKKLGINHIDMKNKTLKCSKYKRAIDHIFLSKEFSVISKEIIKDIPTSDHYPIIMKIKLDKS